LLKIGSLILINTNLSYLGGRQGIIIDREDSGRWLVKVAGLLSLDEEESIILSLDESEFTEIDLALEKFLYLSIARRPPIYRRDTSASSVTELRSTHFTVS